MTTTPAPDPSAPRALTLGHAVLHVRSLAVSAPFYRDALGLTEVARYADKMAFFSCGDTHHNLALHEIGADAAAPNPRAVGLYHLAFKVGDSLDALRAFRDRLAALEIPLVGQADHCVSQAVYFRDPDGLMVEAYVDADPAIWRDKPDAVAHIGALDL